MKNRLSSAQRLPEKIAIIFRWIKYRIWNEQHKPLTLSRGIIMATIVFGAVSLLIILLTPSNIGENTFSVPLLYSQEHAEPHVAPSEAKDIVVNAPYEYDRKPVPPVAIDDCHLSTTQLAASGLRNLHTSIESQNSLNTIPSVFSDSTDNPQKAVEKFFPHAKILGVQVCAYSPQETAGESSTRLTVYHLLWNTIPEQKKYFRDFVRPLGMYVFHAEPYLYAQKILFPADDSEQIEHTEFECQGFFTSQYYFTFQSREPTCSPLYSIFRGLV